MAARVPLMVITGPVGVGKTSVAAAVSDLLDRVGVAHAMIDLDHLRWCSPSPTDDPFRLALGLRNLAAVWANYRAAGAARLILADVVESRAELAGYRTAVPGAAIVVVRLRASLPTIGRRLAGRDVGASLESHRQRAAELARQMERDRVEDLLVDTEGKSAEEVAREVVTRGNWLNPSERPRPRPASP